jgi:hypothetical protein
MYLHRSPGSSDDDDDDYGGGGDDDDAFHITKSNTQYFHNSYLM